MLYYVEGTVALLQPGIQSGIVVIDCGGVGYTCHTSQTTINPLTVGQKARLFTYLSVRETGIDLYGFGSEEERSCFEMMLGVSGVGPKAALSILSSAPPDQLALAIVTSDERLLMQAPGIGKKIAQRIILELRDKMSKDQLESANYATRANGIAGGATGGSRANHTQEAVAALMVLGYRQAEALHAMEGLDTSHMETEDIVRQCLKALMKQP